MAVLAALLFTAASSASADCPYFRVKSKPMKCAVAVPTAAEPAANTDDLPGLDLQEGQTIRLMCSCEYALKGSAPQCDFDRIEEMSFTLPADQGERTCQRRALLCQDLCPRQQSF
jgi:hypothetical protein